MNTTVCYYCGSEVEEKTSEYVYRYQGEHFVVPHTPVLVCRACGMRYYEAAVLKKIERWFLAIREKTAQPDRYLHVPEKAYSES